MSPSMHLSAIKMAHANRPDAHVFLRDLERAFSLGHQFGIERSAEVVDQCNKTYLYNVNVAARIRALKVETARPVATLDSDFL